MRVKNSQEDQQANRQSKEDGQAHGRLDSPDRSPLPFKFFLRHPASKPRGIAKGCYSQRNGRCVRFTHLVGVTVKPLSHDELHHGHQHP